MRLALVSIPVGGFEWIGMDFVELNCSHGKTDIHL